MRPFLLVGGAVVWGTIADSPPASAICRVVEPTASAGVGFDPRTAALFVVAPDQIVAYDCVDDMPDAGMPDGGPIDAGPLTAIDAGDDAGAMDAGADAAIDPLDAGVANAAIADAAITDASTLAMDASLDAGSIDAGPPPICPGGLTAVPIRDTIVSVVVQPSVLASGGTAGLVMPVPARPDVLTGSPTLFETAASLIEPLIHETATVREDSSLGHQCSDPHYSSDASDVLLHAPLMLYGCGGYDSEHGGDYADASSGYYRPGTEMRDPEVTVYGDAGVVRFETFPSTEAYDVTVVNASSAEALNLWLDEHGFAHDADDDAAFAAYVGEGAWFLAVHVHPPDMGGEQLALAPIVATWRGSTIPITHRLQYDPAGGVMVTDAFVIAPTRMSSADGSAYTEHAAPATFAGTELAGFGLNDGWLTRLSFTRFVQEEMADSELVPIDAGEQRAQIERTVEIRIPAPCCPDQSIPSSSYHRTFTHERWYVGSFEENPVPESWFYPDEPFDDSAACAYGYYDEPTYDEPTYDEPTYDDGDGCGSSSSSGGSGRMLRGCSTSSRRARPRNWGAIALGWSPLAAALYLVWRNRRRK